MWGIMEKTPGMQNITAWIKRNGSLLLFNSKGEAQKVADNFNEKEKWSRYFVRRWY